MIVLASGFSGLAPLVLIVPIACILGVVSFYPAWRGHWTALLLAAPLLIVGVLGGIVWAGAASTIPMASGLYLLSPLIVALTSLGLWTARWRALAPRGRR